MLFLDGRVELPVEVLQGFCFPEGCDFYPTFYKPVGAHVQFVLEYEFKELSMTKAIAGGLLEPHLQRLRHPGQVQFFECCL